MGTVYIDISLSLDGFLAGPNVSVANPLGDGGERLHDWMFAGRAADESRKWELERFSTTGALIMGRTMFDVGVGPWGDDPVYRAPVFIVTHRAASPITKRGGTTYTFLTDGPDDALRRARAAAGDEDICVAGGAKAIQHYLSIDVVDELRLHLVPLLLGGGTPMFDAIGRPQALELVDQSADRDGVLHLRYRPKR